jgi:hypothetical protein
VLVMSSSGGTATRSLYWTFDQTDRVGEREPQKLSPRHPYRPSVDAGDFSVVISGRVRRARSCSWGQGQQRGERGVALGVGAVVKGDRHDRCGVAMRAGRRPDATASTV